MRLQRVATEEIAYSKWQLYLRYLHTKKYSWISSSTRVVIGGKLEHCGGPRFGPAGHRGGQLWRLVGTIVIAIRITIHIKTVVTIGVSVGRWSLPLGTVLQAFGHRVRDVALRRALRALQSFWVS